MNSIVSSPIIEFDDVFVDGNQFGDRMAAVCSAAFNIQRGTRITSNYRLVFHLHQKNERDIIKTCLELDPKDWLAAKRGQQTPTDPRDLTELVGWADSYISRQRELSRDENARLLENFDEAAARSMDIRPVFSRKKRCTRSNCRDTGQEHRDQFFHLNCSDICVKTLKHGETCGFYANPDLWIYKNNDIVVYRRSSIVPELLLAPQPGSQILEHTNEELAVQPKFWKTVRTFIEKYIQRGGFLPIFLSMNFGGWESATHANHLGVRSECHGHLHIVFPLREALRQASPLVGRFSMPETYRDANIRTMMDASARYSFLSINNHFASLREEMKQENDSIRNEIRQQIGAAENRLRTEMREMESRLLAAIRRA